jgi:hypothetical protein
MRYKLKHVKTNFMKSVQMSQWVQPVNDISGIGLMELYDFEAIRRLSKACGVCGVVEKEAKPVCDTPETIRHSLRKLPVGKGVFYEDHPH